MRLAVSATLLVWLPQVAATSDQPVSLKPLVSVALLPPKPLVEWPHLAEQRQAEAAIIAQQALEAAQAAQAAADALAAQQAVVVPQVYYTAYSESGILTGSYGYALAGGNCVDEPGVDNPGWGDPIDWPVLYSRPAIGETVLFWYNHTGVVTGLWSNGDIEIRHQNWDGPAQTRFPRSEFRGFR